MEGDSFGPIISSYSRADAIADGTLVDVAATAREAGIRFPVALTRGVYETYVAWTDEDAETTGAIQNEAGRLWDVVWMLSLAARKAEGDRLSFSLYVVPREQRAQEAKLVTLLAVCGPGDDAEPVLTVMLDESEA